MDPLHVSTFGLEPSGGNRRGTGSRSRWRSWLAASVAGFLLLGAYPGWLLWTDNLHVVKPNELYRSGQMTAAELAATVKSKQIRSVINLRGPNPGTPWYDDEIRISTALGIEHADVALSAKREVTDEQIAQLESLLQTLPKPILIHCQGGSDRAGFVSAFYLNRFEKVPAAEAGKQLTVWFGHIPYLFKSETIAMDRSFEKYCVVGGSSVEPGTNRTSVVSGLTGSATNR